MIKTSFSTLKSYENCLPTTVLLKIVIEQAIKIPQFCVAKHIAISFSPYCTLVPGISYGDKI